MSNYIVLENIPNTPEGRAFLKQLRKYLQPQFKMRSRGRHRDRKGLANELAAKGAYCFNGDWDAEQKEKYIHLGLRRGMSCKYADRITTTVEEKLDRHLYKESGQWFYQPGATSNERQGPFRTYRAAQLAKRMTEGVAP